MEGYSEDIDRLPCPSRGKGNERKQVPYSLGEVYNQGEVQEI